LARLFDGKPSLPPLTRLLSSSDPAELLRPHKDALTVDHVKEWQGLVATLVRSDLRKALEVARLAVAAARILRSPLALAVAWRAQAEARLFAGRLRSALRYYDRAVAAYGEVGEEGEMARTMVGRMNLLALLGQFERAIDDSREIRRILTARGDTVYLAKFHMNMGNVYVNRNEFAKTLREYRRARVLFDSLGIRDAAVVGLDVNRATILSYLDRFEEALAIYSKARDEARSLGFRLVEAQITHNIGHMYLLSSRHHEALRFLREARDTFDGMGDALQVAKCDLNRSDVYLRLNLIEEAASLADRSSETFLKTGLRYDAALALVIAGRALGQAGRGAEALKRLRRARLLFRREGAALRAGLVALRTAQHHLGLGRLPEARRAFREAERELAGFRVASVEALSLQTRSILERMEGRLDRSESSLVRARKILRRVADRWLHFQTDVLLGMTYAAKGETAKGIVSFRRATRLADRMRLELGTDDFKVAFLADKQEVYDRLLDLVLSAPRRRRVEDIYDLCEQARSRAMVDQLQAAETGEPARGGAGARLRNTERVELERKLSWFRARENREALVGEGGPEEGRAENARRIREIERRILELRREAAEKRSASLSPAEPASLSGLQEGLNRNEAVLEYIVLPDQIRVLCIHRDRVSLVLLECHPKAVLRLVEQFWNQIDLCSLPPDFTRRRLPYLTEGANRVLRGLHDMLWRPLKEHLAVHSVTVVPHAFLHGLPFHAFFDGDSYLLDEHAIHYAPSASVDSFCRRRARGRFARALLVGVTGDGLAWVEEEIGEVRQALACPEVGVRRAIGVEAFLNEAQGASVIHAATHGRFRRDNPAFSSLWLGDEFLYMYQVLESRIRAELVALSACQTGASVVQRGDEPVSLARAFLLAGAASVVVSLWSVRDETVPELMKKFYGLLREGLPKDEALREALLEVRREHPHPYSWAPFILMGNPRPLGRAGTERGKGQANSG
jgi:CHAT domain-containing protein